jgi:hypothetical protein
MDVKIKFWRGRSFAPSSMCASAREDYLVVAKELLSAGFLEFLDGEAAGKAKPFS